MSCAVRLIPHGPCVPISLPPRVLDTVEDSVTEKSWSDSQLTESSEHECNDNQQPKPFNQAELNDFVQKLEFAKSICSYSGFQVELLLGKSIVRMNIFVSLPKNTL